MKGLFAAVILLCAAGAAASVPEQARWQFKVLLDNREIGSHQFTVSEEDGRQTIETEASFDVKVLFVNLYRYRHQNREVWQDNCLASINSVTDDNGKDFVVSGQAAGAYFRLSTVKTEKELPSCIMTFAYWNPAFLAADKLLNSQTGEYEDVTITKVGEEALKFNGQTIKAVRYIVDLDAGPITLWYAADDFRWLVLKSVAGGGRKIRYEPVTVPTSGSSSKLAIK